MPALARILAALLRRTPPAHEPLADAELLARFAAHRDATAFELLVWRHGAMVLGVCRRMLRHEQSAEDAFQAVFLVLAKKAGAVRTQLAGWLHATARRVCLRMAKRKPLAVLEEEPPSAVPPDAAESAELAAVLDAEIARLPEKFRLAVILCYLRGLTTEQAAEHLGVPRGTVLSRLASARKRLAERLTAKGITVPAVFLTATVTTTELAADMGGRTASLAVGFVTATLPVSIPTQLATEVLRMATRKMMATVTAITVLLMAGVGTSVGWVLADGEKPAAAKKTDPPKAGPVRAEPVLVKAEAPQQPQVQPDAGKQIAEKRQAIRELLMVEEDQLRRAETWFESPATNDDLRRKIHEGLDAELSKQTVAAGHAYAAAETVAYDAQQKVYAQQAYQRNIAQLDELPKIVAERKSALDKAKATLAAAQAKQPLDSSTVTKAGSDVRGWQWSLGMAESELERIRKLQDILIEAGHDRSNLADWERSLTAAWKDSATKRREFERLQLRQRELTGRWQHRSQLDSKFQQERGHHEINTRLARIRVLKEIEFDLQLREAGLTPPTTIGGGDKMEQVLRELEELRREIKR